MKDTFPAVKKWHFQLLLVVILSSYLVLGQ